MAISRRSCFGPRRDCIQQHVQSVLGLDAADYPVRAAIRFDDEVLSGLRLCWKLRTRFHVALLCRCPLRVTVTLHLETLRTLAKGLLKATRECRREAVAKNSRHFINVEALGLFQQLLRRFHPDIPGIAANSDLINLLKLPAHQRKADLKLLALTSGAK